MLKMISKFAASPFSGYALIALLIAAAGAGYWFWSELKEFGSLQAQSQAQAETIKEQKNTLAVLASESKAKDAALTKQNKQTQILMRNARLQQLAVMEAKKYADKALKQCLDMRIARGMRFGESRKNGSGEDQARSKLDADVPDADS